MQRYEENVTIDLNDNFYVSENPAVEDFKHSTPNVDPLEGLGFNYTENFYNLNRVVFAEPIQSEEKFRIIKNKRTNNEFIFIDKIIKEKRSGKRNKYHINLDNNTTPICPKTNCNKKFASITLLKAHIRKIHCAEHNFMCDQCGLSFTARYLLIRHMAVHEMQKVQCPICHKLLSKRTNLQNHMRFVHRMEELKCHLCDQRFEKRSQLTRRRSTHKKQ